MPSQNHSIFEEDPHQFFKDHIATINVNDTIEATYYNQEGYQKFRVRLNANGDKSLVLVADNNINYENPETTSKHKTRKRNRKTHKKKTHRKKKRTHRKQQKGGASTRQIGLATRFRNFFDYNRVNLITKLDPSIFQKFKEANEYLNAIVHSADLPLYTMNTSLTKEKEALENNPVYDNYTGHNEDVERVLDYYKDIYLYMWYRFNSQAEIENDLGKPDFVEYKNGYYLVPKIGEFLKQKPILTPDEILRSKSLPQLPQVKRASSLTEQSPKDEVDILSMLKLNPKKQTNSLVEKAASASASKRSDLASPIADSNSPIADSNSPRIDLPTTHAFASAAKRSDSDSARIDLPTTHAFASAAKRSDSDSATDELDLTSEANSAKRSDSRLGSATFRNPLTSPSPSRPMTEEQIIELVKNYTQGFSVKDKRNLLKKIL